MTSNEKFTGMEKIDLASAEVHAPVEVTFSVYVQLPDGRMGSMRAAMPPGQIPSRAAMKLVLDSFTDADGKIPGAPVGARLATRGEFVSHLVKRETGEAFALDAGAQYLPIPSDIPHAMLVHAICGGAGFEYSNEGFALAKEYENRGLLTTTWSGHGACDPHHNWNRTALAKLPDDVLLALYARVTA